MPHKDPEARRVYNRAYHAANREKHLEAMRSWYGANTERSRRATKTWHEENPPSVNPGHAYVVHKATAKARGIAFLLTFEEWMTIWNDSGNWHLRGNLKGHYVMARHGDTGPYAVGNVRICTVSENMSEANKGKKLSPEHCRLISEALRRRKKT